VPGFGVRITDKGSKSFVLLAHYPMKRGAEGAWEINQNRNTVRELARGGSHAMRDAIAWVSLQDSQEPRFA
jgi:hypothetical protein